MTFEEWQKSTKLPSTATTQLLASLSDMVKRKFLKRSNSEAMLVETIEDVNHGGV